MRLAWFSPLSPRVSGLATYSAAIVAALAPDADIDVFVDDDDPADLAPRLGGSVAVRPAHDFVWMQARRPYDLTVYQLANAASHAYLWGYAVRYPGLAVLHDQVLHHARGAHLRRAHRRRDYRAEVRYDRPDLEASIPAVADLAVPHLLANWPLVRPILATARRCVVHDSAAADDFRGRYPEGRVDVVRYGVTPPAGGRCAAGRQRSGRLRGAPAYRVRSPPPGDPARSGPGAARDAGHAARPRTVRGRRRPTPVRSGPRGSTPAPWPVPKRRGADGTAARHRPATPTSASAASPSRRSPIRGCDAWPPGARR